MEEIKFAFIISDEEEHPFSECLMFANKNIPTKIYGVKNFEEACTIAKKLENEGFNRIGLCGAFQGEGYKMVQNAVSDNIKVGCIIYNL